MDEYLFITLAKLKADRLSREREQQAATAMAESPAEWPQPSAGHSARAVAEDPLVFATAAVEGTAMKIPLALAAALVITFGTLGVLDWGLIEAQRPPRGEVTVTQLPHPSESPLFAQVAIDGQAVGAVAGNL